MRTNDINRTFFSPCTDLLSIDCASFFFYFNLFIFLLWKQHKARPDFHQFHSLWLMCRAGYWSTAKAEDGQKNKEKRERERGVSVQSWWWYYVYIFPCRALVFVEWSLWNIVISIVLHTLPSLKKRKMHNESLTQKFSTYPQSYVCNAFFGEVTMQTC